MKRYIKLFALPLIATAGIATTSCNLDEVNPHAGDTSIKSYETWLGLQSFCYSTLNEELYTASDWLFASEAGTDLWNAKANGNGYQSDFYYENYGTNNNSTKKLWLQCYSMVTNCNTVINEASNFMGKDAKTVELLVAETKTLRAFFNFLIVSNFGPVTLNLESSSSLTGNVDLYPTRTSEKVFYEQIVKDLTEALPVLGVEPYQNNRARVTKKTVMGLLARVYAQRAGLGSKYGDAEKYWKLAAETAEELIDNAGAYGAHLYTDIADMWSDANNRSNREALFTAVDADANSEAWAAATKRNKLLAYSAGGCYKDLFNHDPSNKSQSNYYGRMNAQTWSPSKYLLYCFNPKWDRRWEYSFIYGWSDWSMGQPGWQKYSQGQKTLTEELVTKYGIDPSHVGETINPYADCNAITSTFAGNQYPASIWPKDFVYNEPSKDEFTDASGNLDKEKYEKAVAEYIETVKGSLLQVAASSSEINQPGKSGSTKTYAIPYPIDVNDTRFNTVYVHEPLSEADKAKCRYCVVVLSDLFGSNGMPYGNTANGSENGNSPKIGNGTTDAGSSPSLHKFNWSYNGVFYGSNLQVKTGDMYIMRMAEIYLIAAEARQMLGEEGKAASHLNVLRKRAARPGANESEWKLSKATEEDIFDEYARELCGEFSRWALLKRHNAFESRLAKYNPRAAKSFKPAYYNKPVSADFLSTILNDKEYGDNGYGAGSSGLENID